MSEDHIHIQPLFFFLLVFLIKIPLKIFLKQYEEKAKRENGKKKLNKILSEQEEIDLQINELEQQISQLDPVSDLVKVSKMQRQIIRLNKKR